jgi:phosphate-selective porin OprO and OprP
MKNVLTIGAMALAVAAMAPAAYADKAETQGGLKVKTDDGRFEFGLGGRIHYDMNVFVDDNATSVATDAVGGNFLRRTRLTLSGRAYGWEYKFENEFAGQNATLGSGYRDMYIATTLGPGKLTIGQFKPHRGMEELTSSNELTVMERGFASASGIIGQQFVTGLGYLVTDRSYTAGLSVYRPNIGLGTGGGSQSNEGIGTTGRFTFAPINASGSVLHLGGWASVDNPHNGSTVGSASVRYAGRLGPSQAIGATAANRGRTMVGAELAGAFGPLFFQSEYVLATLDQGAMPDQDVQAYYLMASFHVTGESKPYRNGVFRSVKPASAMGAVELAAKYDYIENKDSAAAPEVTSTTLGVNYYVNPNVRFMLNYVMGESDANGREVDVIAARAQLHF